MPSELKGAAVIGQSGGPTHVINESLVGVVEGLREFDTKGLVTQVLGARHAVSGIVKNDFIDLTDLPQDFLDKLAVTPSSGLGSSRDKPDAEYCKRIFEAFEKNDVRYFFYIGGNDSSDTCRLVAEAGQSVGYDLRAYHVAKTIDNDLVMNDHTPGFGSAARFVACAFMGDNLDNKALPGIKINVIMGRHAGFLTAASMLGRNPDTHDGPHLVYVPEVEFNEDKFLADVERVYTKLGRCLVAVSEGIHDATGEPMVTKLQEDVEKDAHGNVQLSGTGALGDLLANLVKDKLGTKLNQKLRVRADTFGYLQRSFASAASPVDQAEARAAGKKAAELALQGDHASGSIALHRHSQIGPGEAYQCACERIELTDVAAKTKTLDPKYFVDGCDIDESFKHYGLPLVGDLPITAQL